MKNIFLLPTDKPTGIFETNNGLQFSIMNKVRYGEFKGFHLYITSDEEIEEGDYYKSGKFIWQMKYPQWGEEGQGGAKKIILTTDPDLIKDGVQEIDSEFLEWFAKNPTHEEIEVFYGLFNAMGRQMNPMNLTQNHSQCVWKYNVIIPNEKQNEQKELRRKLLNLINNLEEDELLELSKEKSISYEEFRVKASEGLLEESDDENRFYALGKELDNKLEEEPKCLYDTPKSFENSECRVLNKCNGDRVRPKQENFSWGKLVKEAGSEEELIKILKLPHIAPLIREAMRNNCKK